MLPGNPENLHKKITGKNFKFNMKKAKALLMAGKTDKGKDSNEEMRGRIVEKGIPLWVQNDRFRHIQFKAGKMYVIGNMVHADPRKGYISIEQDRYQVMHFCWMERDAVGTKEDDLTPEKYDCIFKRVPKCTTGRVYTMKIRSSNKNYFYWMQEQEADKDTGLVAKVNYLMNFPPAWLTFPQIVINMSTSQTSYESAESEEQEDPELEGGEGQPEEVINEMDPLTKILEGALKYPQDHKMEDGHSVEMFSMKRNVSNIITQYSLRGCRTFASLPSDDSDSEYADAQEGEDFEYLVLRPTHGTVSASGKPGPLNDNQRNQITEVIDAALAGTFEEEFVYGETTEMTTDRDEQHLYSKRSDGGVGVPTDPNVRESNPQPNMDLNLNKHVNGNRVPRKITTIIGSNMDLNYNNRDTEVPKATRNYACVTNSTQGHVFLDGRIYTINKRLPGQNCLTESAPRTKLIESYGLSQETQEPVNENVNLNVNANSYGKPPSFREEDSWDATKKVMVARQADEVNTKLKCGVTKSMTEYRGKPLLINRSEDVEKDIITGYNEFINDLNCHLDINAMESGSCETPEDWESTTEPDDTQFSTLNAQTDGNTIHEETVTTEKSSIMGCSTESPMDSNHRETGPETLEKWESTDERNFHLFQDGQIRIVEAGNNAKAMRNTVERSMLNAKSSKELFFEKNRFEDRKELSQRTVHDYHSHNDASSWESVTNPIIDLNDNDQAATLSSPLNNTENNSQTANNKLTESILSTNEKTTGQERISPSEMAPTFESAKDKTKTSSLKTQDNVVANIFTLLIPPVKGTTVLTSSSESRDPQCGVAVKKKVQAESFGSTVAVAAPPSGSHLSISKSLSKKGAIPGCQRIRPSALILPHESGSMPDCSGTTKQSSTLTSTDDLPGCTKLVLSSSESGQCSTEVVDQFLSSSSKLKNILEQPGSSDVLKPTSFELCRLDTKSRDTVLSRFSSFMTSSNSSLSEGANDDDDSTIKDMSDPSKCEPSIQDKDEQTAEHREIKNETTKSNDGAALHENDETSLDYETSTNNIAMIALVRTASTEKSKVDAEKPTNTQSSRVIKNSQSVSNSKIHNRGKNQSNKATRSVASELATSCSPGMQDQAPDKLDKDIPGNDKVSNSIIHETTNSGGKKCFASNMSKSLEEITDVTGPHKHVTYNLRKRPQPSLSGPTIVGISQDREGRSSKRPRVTSPGMPLPLPFRVSDASPARLTRSRHGQVSGSALLQSPNQMEGVTSQTLRKRPIDEEEDRALEEPPAKKAKASVGNSSKSSTAGSSRQRGEEDSASGSKPALSSGGSGSSPGSPTLDKPSPSPITSKTASHDSSQSADTSPRYNLRSRSAKIETEPVRIREIQNSRPETVIRARTVSRIPSGPPNRTNRDRSQNTRPVIIEDKNSSKSKPNGQKPSDSDRRSNP